MSDRIEIERLEVECAKQQARAMRAESERDEWKAKCEAAEKDNEQLRNELVCRGDAVRAAEGGEHLARAAADRAESESESEAAARAHLSGQATARSECVSGYTGANGECNDCGKLSCPMSARTDHERAVLLSCERAEIVAGCHRGTRCCAKFKDDRYVAQAELARREAEK